MSGRRGDEDPDPLVAEVRLFLDDLEPRATRLLVALSGGPDSTALVHALARLDRAPALFAVHVNHQLRGAASFGDEEWVRAFCESMGVPLTVLDGTLDAEDVRHTGIEAAARAVRYRLLAAERERLAANYVATAHTRSDQAETVLLRLITGRGTWRLSGIAPESADGLIRPLLRVPRTEVLRYLDAHGIVPRHDASNEDHRFLRNRVRHSLLPLIDEWNPRIEELLADTAALELDRGRALAELLSSVRQAHVTEHAEGSSIRLGPSLSPHVLRSLLLEQIRRIDPSTREVDAASLRAVADLKPDASRTISPILVAKRASDSIDLRLLPGPTRTSPWLHEIRPGETIQVPEAGYWLSIRDAPPGGAVASADRLRQVIQIPFEPPVRFEVRSRRAGDRFRPLGMDRDKNLAEFLIDRRIPVGARDSLPLFVCNDSIAWIPGVEVGDAFRVTPTAGWRLEIVAERIGGDR